MSYQGDVAIIPLGAGGLHTDDPQTVIDPRKLIRAKNISLGNGVVEKDPGSLKWNQTAYPAGIRAVFDWWPDDVTQRVIVILSNGKVYRSKNIYHQEEITASGSAPSTLTPGNQPHILPCGAESAGRSKKFMIFTGKDAVQVVTGDGTTRSNISSPAADWSGSNQPSFGFMHLNRIVAFGNPNDPHRAYVSDDDDHEQFASGGANMSFYPGEGERLFSGFVYKGRAFLFKYPRGMYYIDDSAGASPTTWIPRKVTSSFGVASAHPAIEAVDDLFLANASGSVTSVGATQAFGDVKSGDILSMLRCESYMRNTTSPNGNLDRWALWYQDKKRLLFTYRSGGGLRNDRIMTIDLSQQQNPRVSWSEKDQPNCLALMKDCYGIERPVCGSEDGFIYQLDRPDRAGPSTSAPGAVTAALAGAGAGNLSAGDYKWKLTFVTDYGETEAGTISATVTVADPSTNGKAAISAIPTDSTGRVRNRKLYRTTAGGSTYKLVTTIYDNITTTYTDNVADASLGATAPSSNNTARYTAEFMTPHLDFGYVNQAHANTEKNYDFLELTFEPTGRWNVYVDVFIDGVFSETVTFTPTWGPVLDEFTLDTHRLSGRIPRAQMKPLHGKGRRIAFRVYNSGYLENFRLCDLRVYYRLSGQDQRAASV